jgi:flavodoxin
MTSVVVYSSEGGTAKGVATEIGAKTGLTVVDAKSFRFEDIDECPIVIFVVANYGRGESVLSEKPIWARFLALSADLSPLKFAVFTCGSSAFGPTFGRFGKTLEAKLKELKGTQLGTLGIRDATGANSTDLDAWIASLGLSSS